MKFIPTAIPGAYVIELERIGDDRGFFARAWCTEEFEREGLNPSLRQCNVSFNERRGTLRGMHYQAAPGAEAKIIRCTMGAIYDVILDLRETSAAFGQWFAEELSCVNRRMLYAPEGVAHGFLTLHDGSEVFYQMTQAYDPTLVRGVRWDDPAFGIVWPIPISVLSTRDASFPNFRK